VWDGLKWVGNKIAELFAPMKEFGAKVLEYMVKPFGVFGKVLSYVLPGMSKIAGNAGESVGTSFTEGWNAGIADFNGSTAVEKAATGGGTTGIPGAFTNVPGSGAPPAPDPNAAKAKQISDSITGGGQRNVTVNVNKLIEQFTLQSQNVKEGVDQVGDMLIKTLLQVLNSANQIQTNG
jgi:hypothetical protein